MTEPKQPCAICGHKRHARHLALTDISGTDGPEMVCRWCYPSAYGPLRVRRWRDQITGETIREESED